MQSRKIPIWMWILGSQAIFAATLYFLLRRDGQPARPPPGALARSGADAIAAVGDSSFDGGAFEGDVTAEEDSGDVAMAAEPTTTVSSPATGEPGVRAEVGAEQVTVVVSPPALRVWHHTLVRLEARTAAGTEDRWLRFVWHFEDGTEPATGAEVLHIFPESVTDRFVTLEAFDRRGVRTVVSRRLPIERLSVVHVDGADAPAPELPRARGVRLLWVGEGGPVDGARGVGRGLGSLAPLAEGPLREALGRAEVAAVVAVGGADHVTQVTAWSDATLPGVAVLALDDRVAADALAPAPSGPPLRLIRGLPERTSQLPESHAIVIGDLVLVPYDARPLAVPEATLAALRRDLRLAAAWPALVVVSARPLAPLAEGDVVADRAYRVYEYALRERALVVVSATSHVAWDGRYGGIGAVGVGRAHADGCARPLAHDQCQPATVTLTEIRADGTRVWHLRLDQPGRWLDEQDLPPTVGRYRRDLRPMRSAP